MKPPVLDVVGLEVAFRNAGVWRPVVRDVSFTLGERETLAIVGESGSGKSVTALALMQLVPQVNGRVTGQARLGGENLLALDEARMEEMRGNRIAMVFQEPMTSLNPVLTIGEQIGESLAVHRGLHGASAEAEVLRLLERVRIPGARQRLHEYPHRFSGGMRQRVMIAMALACQPQVLIADEPTTALDVTVQAQILDLIRSLQAELGMSVIFITHDMGVVAEVADRALVMHLGEKVEEGATASVFALPQHAYTRSLLAAVPVLGTVPPDAQTLPIGPPGRPLLEVNGLCKRFDVRGGFLRRVRSRVHAVEDVSFTLHRAETLALVGESGCGKTTIGRSILRLVEPDSGSVRFDGTDLLALDRNAFDRMRQHMQIVFQDPYASLDPRVPVGAAIAEPMVVHRVASRRDAPARVAALLQRVGLLPEHAQRYPHEFSGGQRQRICIARALALQPQLLVADEAVSALDVSIKAQVIELLQQLQRDLGLAYLFISHDIAVVERVSHRVAVMYLGEMVEVGPRAAVLGSPQHPYTKKLIAAVPVPDPARRRSRAALPAEDLPSPMRAVGYRAPARRWREVSAGHLVREED
jgi:peptide/nickel transport system ATP-binding protein